MSTNENTIQKTIRRFGSFRYVLVAEGVAVGVLSGSVVVLFRLLLEKAGILLNAALAFQKENPWFIPVWFLILLAAAVAVALLLKWEPYISGSGIPQVEGEMQGRLDPCWWRVLLAKIAGGVLSIGCGLSLGREGPSIQLGAVTAKGFSRLTHRMKTEERLLMTCGASAGLSAAFNAPFAGVLFSLEEIHKNFSPEVLLSTMASSITANFISRNVFGLKPVFTFDVPVLMPLKEYGHVIALGLVLGLLGVLYNKCIALSQNMFQKIPRVLPRIVIPFLLAGVFGLVYPEVLGGGHELVERATEKEFVLGALVLLLAVKFLFSMVSFGSGAPGGIFLPLLVMGAVTGGIYGLAASSLFGTPNELFSDFIILGMAGFFAAIVRAPVTGIILIVEMTGSFSHLLTLSIVSLFAYLVADALRCLPIYDQLLHRLLRGKHRVAQTGEKVLLDGVVSHGSIAEASLVSEVAWPETCLVVSLVRGQSELIPKGDTKIEAGDRVVLLCGEDAAGEAHRALEEFCLKVRG